MAFPEALNFSGSICPGIGGSVWADFPLCHGDGLEGVALLCEMFEHTGQRVLQAGLGFQAVVEHHDAAQGQGAAQPRAQLFHQDPVLQLQGGQHRARGDPAGLQHRPAQQQRQHSHEGQDRHEGARRKARDAADAMARGTTGPERRAGAHEQFGVTAGTLRTLS